MQEDKIREFIAPSLEKRTEFMEHLKEISIYLIIALISLVIVFIVPLLSGCIQGDFGMNFPTTAEGWILYASMNAGTTLGNVALFILFKQQAIINSKKHPNYIKAREILYKTAIARKAKPRSPRQMNLKEYTTKIIFIIVFSVGSFITITNLIISFDIVTFISCLISTFVSLTMGWITMIQNEAYWTDEYLQYAKYIEEEINEAEKPQGEQNNDSI